MTRRYAVLAGCTVLALPLIAEDPGPWTSLFDSESLKGWTAEGKAVWTIQDRAIVGRQGPNLAGGDLYTEREWADFELEAEFKLNEPANSGIWFRRTPSQPGYQVDILDEPQHPDILSGSLYADGKGFLVKNGDPKTIRKNDWNRVRLVVIGDSITITMNGATVVKTRDSSFLGPGRIGIQVHGGKWVPSMEVRMRRIRIRDRS